jgi:hypothetical protein
MKVTNEFQKLIHSHFPQAKLSVEKSDILPGKFYEVAEIWGKHTRILHGTLSTFSASSKHKKEFINFILDNLK